MRDVYQPIRSSGQLTCPDVVDTRADSIVSAESVLHALDSVELHQLRLHAEEVKIAGKPRFRCPLCWRPLGLRGGWGSGDDIAHRPVALHFAHPREPEHHCAYKTGGDYTPEQYAAMKYNGLKETRAHRLVKARLWSGLRLDPWTEPGTLHVERRFKANLPDTSWRQPDVQVQWHAMSVVFEAQLATTFVTVIAQRRNFYRKNGAQLVWVFASPPTDELRFTTKDVVFNNNCNLFVVSKETAERSAERGRLVLEAWWPNAEDRLDDSGSFRWNSEMVTLDQLTFDESQSTVYFVDHEAEVAALREQREQERQKDESRQRGDTRVPPGESGVLLLESESHPQPIDGLDIHDGHAVRDWMLESAKGSIVRGLEDLLLQFQAVGAIARLGTFAEAQRARHFDVAVRALMSLQEGRPIGTKLPNLRSVENWIWSDYRDYYSLFANAVAVWKQENALNAHDAQSAFRMHLKELREQRRTTSGIDPRYRQDTSLHAIFRIAFPELSAALSRIEAVAKTGNISQ